jgi:hypothetical protein
MSEIQVNTINEYTGANGVTIDGVLIKDGNVDGVDVSAITQGITEVDQWSLNTNLTSTTDPITQWTRTTGLLLPSGAAIGTGMSVSSGIWTFPQTGIYRVEFKALVRFSAYSGGYTYIFSTNDNGTTWDNASSTEGQGQANFDTADSNATVILDITDLSNDKVKFRFYDEGSATLVGSSGFFGSGVSFIRLGDT